MGGTAAESGSVEAANRGAVRTRQACGEMRLISDAPCYSVYGACGEMHLILQHPSYNLLKTDGEMHLISQHTCRYHRPGPSEAGER